MRENSPPLAVNEAFLSNGRSEVRRSIIGHENAIQEHKEKCCPGGFEQDPASKSRETSYLPQDWQCHRLDFSFAQTYIKGFPT